MSGSSSSSSGDAAANATDAVVVVVGGWRVQRTVTDPALNLVSVTVSSVEDPAVAFTHPPQALLRGTVTRHDCHLQRWSDLNARIRYRPDDVVVASFPKCGTTFVEHIVLLLLHGADVSRLAGVSTKNSYVVPSTTTTTTTPDLPAGKIWVEACLEQDSRVADSHGAEFARMTWADFDAAPAPRLIKTHAPVHLILGMADDVSMPTGTKVIVVTRNPMDACVSRFYHAFNPAKQGWNFGAWAACWLSGNTAFGDWFAWVRGWWARAQACPDQVLWVQYEDLKEDPTTHIARIARFLGGVDDSPSFIAKVADLSAFQNVKEQAQVDGGDFQNHLRKGVVGDWQSHFSDEMAAAFVAKYQEELRGTQLVYEFGGRVGKLSATQ
jgi:hypothetical protein